MTTDPNGYALIAPNDPNSPHLRRYIVPLSKSRRPAPDIEVALRDGCTGFLLVHNLMWFHEKIESLDNKPPDDWGYAYRPNVNNPSVWSEHAFGLATDKNATLHPNGKDTFTLVQRARLRTHLLRYRGCIRSGAFYVHTEDDMHDEINKPMGPTNKRAIALMKRRNGALILEVNPGLKALILS